MFKVGFGKIGVFDKTYERSMLEISGTILLSGKAYFGHGSRICVYKDAELHIGKDFCNSAMGTVVCAKKITFGDNILTSWDTMIMDTDFHEVENVKTHECSFKEKEILIGNNVWIGTRSVVLKGSVIPNGCIVAANAVITKTFFNECTLLAGNPAIEKKRGVTLHRQNERN